MMIFVLLLLSSLCCPLHAQDFSTGGFITSETDNVTDGTRVLISAPWAVFSKSLYVFTTGIPIQPVYIQAPSGLSVWMTIQCRGGAARMTVPDFVANFSKIQTDPTGEWILPPLPRNSSWPVTGLGIKFNQNVSICNDALGTLVYGKGADNDIAGKAAMTITLNWNATSTTANAMVILTAATTIYIWAPTALTSITTFQATVATVCLIGIFSLCCIGCLNSFGVTYIRRYNVWMARLSRDEQECEQSRVFNPLWIPCASSQPGYYNIDSTPNSLILLQRYMEIKSLTLRIPTAFSLMDRLTRVKYLKSSNYGWFGLELPCGAAAAAPSRSRLQDSSSDDELPPGLQKAAPRSRISRLQGGQSALARPWLKRPSHVQFSPQLMPPAYAQQRAPSHDWQQAQALAQAQAQAAMYYTQVPMDATYPQQMAQPPSMYPGYQYGTRQNPGAQGNGIRNYETITVGYAFIHHMLAEEVCAAASPSNASVCKPEHWQEQETLGYSEENLRLGYHYSICGAQGGPEHRKGKEPMSSSLEPFRAWYRDRILHTLRPRILLDNTASDSSSGSVCCQLEEVTVAESSENRSGGLEGCVCEELPAEKGSEGSNRASECYGSPLSDIYEDVLGSCSPTNSVPVRNARIDVRCAESPLLPMLQPPP